MRSCVSPRQPRVLRKLLMLGGRELHLFPRWERLNPLVFLFVVFPALGWTLLAGTWVRRVRSRVPVEMPCRRTCNLERVCVDIWVLAPGFPPCGVGAVTSKSPPLFLPPLPVAACSCSVAPLGWGLGGWACFGGRWLPG